MKSASSLKKIIAMFIVFICLVSVIPAEAVKNPEIKVIINVPIKQYTSPSPGAGSAVTDELMDSIVEQTLNCEEKIDIEEFNVPVSELYDIIYEVYYETPEIFNLSDNGIVSYYHKAGPLGDFITSLVPEYEVGYNATQSKKLYNQCKAVADGMVADLKGSDLSDAEKALLLHDRLAIHNEYDTEKLENGTLQKEDFTMIGALVNQISVCDGYTRAYDFLLSMVGIDTSYCSSQNMGHAWNIVYIDGKPYYTDVTWDDPTTDIVGRVSHTNFLKSFVVFEGSHYDEKTLTIDYIVLPENTKYDSYYWDASDTAFQYLEGELYYIDNDEAKLKKASSKTSLKSVKATWKKSLLSYYPGNFTRLAGDGENLLYNLDDAIYRYNISTGATEEVYEVSSLNKLQYRNIFGFKLEKDYLIINISNDANFKTDEKTVIRVKYEKPESETVKAGDINGDDDISLSDVSSLAQSIAGWEDLSLVDDALDVNGDGEISLSDVSHLAQYIADWEGIVLYKK